MSQQSTKHPWRQHPPPDEQAAIKAQSQWVAQAKRDRLARLSNIRRIAKSVRNHRGTGP